MDINKNVLSDDSRMNGFSRLSFECRAIPDAKPLACTPRKGPALKLSRKLLAKVSAAERTFDEDPYRLVLDLAEKNRNQMKATKRNPSTVSNKGS